MNKLEVNQVGGFPMTTRILDEIQKAHAVFNGLGGVAGNMTILSGCTVNGSAVSDGVVYVNGEVFEFRGGSVQTKVKIVEVVENLTFQNGNSNPVIKTRYATFGTGVNAMDWADFKRPMETKNMEMALASKEDKTTTAALVATLASKEDKTTTAALVATTAALQARIAALEAVTIANIPSGLIALWGQAAHLIPAGWSEYLPLRGRTAVGYDPGIAEFDVIGDYGGAITHQLTVAEMPSHHFKLFSDEVRGGSASTETVKSDKYVARSANSAKGSLAYEMSLADSAPTLGMTDSIGGSQPFNIMNPYRVVLYIQKD